MAGEILPQVGKLTGAGAPGSERRTAVSGSVSSHCRSVLDRTVSGASLATVDPQGRTPVVHKFACALAAERQKIGNVVHAAHGRTPPEVVESPAQLGSSQGFTARGGGTTRHMPP